MHEPKLIFAKRSQLNLLVQQLGECHCNYCGNTNLINSSVNCRVKDARDEQHLNLGWIDVQLPGDEADFDLRVRFDQLDQHLSKEKNGLCYTFYGQLEQRCSKFASKQKASGIKHFCLETYKRRNNCLKIVCLTLS